MAKNTENTTGLDAMRLDKWLWSARFFKTRQIAVSAIKSGKVMVNGNRAKPSRSISKGDRLRIDKKGLVFEIDVHEMSLQRLPARLAVNLYSETASSIERREKIMTLRRLDRLAVVQQPKTKPTKRMRQERVKAKRGGY